MREWEERDLRREGRGEGGREERGRKGGWEGKETDLNIGPATADEASFSPFPVSGTNHRVYIFPGSSTTVHL